MRLPVRNKGTRTLTIFMEPLCDQYELAIGAEAIIDLEDGLPHSIDFSEGWVAIYDEGCNATVEIVSEGEQSVVKAIEFVRGWLYRLDAWPSADALDRCIVNLESNEGYVKARLKVFWAFHQGFQAADTVLASEVRATPAWFGDCALAAAYDAGRTAAHRNHMARTPNTFPDLTSSPFDTDVARAKFDHALAVIRASECPAAC